MKHIIQELDESTLIDESHMSSLRCERIGPAQEVCLCKNAEKWKRLCLDSLHLSGLPITLVSVLITVTTSDLMMVSY